MAALKRDLAGVCDHSRRGADAGPGQASATRRHPAGLSLPEELVTIRAHDRYNAVHFYFPVVPMAGGQVDATISAMFRRRTDDGPETGFGQAPFRQPVQRLP